MRMPPRARHRVCLEQYVEMSTNELNVIACRGRVDNIETNLFNRFQSKIDSPLGAERLANRQFATRLAVYLNRGTRVTKRIGANEIRIMKIISLVPLTNLSYAIALPFSCLPLRPVHLRLLNMRVFHLNLLSSTSKRLQHVQVSLRVARECMFDVGYPVDVVAIAVELLNRMHKPVEHIQFARTLYAHSHRIGVNLIRPSKNVSLAKQVLRCGDRVWLRFVLVSLSMVACVRACLSGSRISISTSHNLISFFLYRSTLSSRPSLTLWYALRGDLHVAVNVIRPNRNGYKVWIDNRRV